jgi:hypothetical protein
MYFIIVTLGISPVETIGMIGVSIAIHPAIWSL